MPITLELTGQNPLIWARLICVSSNRPTYYHHKLVLYRINICHNYSQSERSTQKQKPLEDCEQTRHFVFYGLTICAVSFVIFHVLGRSYSSYFCWLSILKIAHGNIYCSSSNPCIFCDQTSRSQMGKGSGNLV